MQRELTTQPPVVIEMEARISEMESRAVRAEEMVSMRERRVDEITSQCVEVRAPPVSLRMSALCLTCALAL